MNPPLTTVGCRLQRDLPMDRIVGNQSGRRYLGRLAKALKKKLLKTYFHCIAHGCA
jgi:hypothetical protein